MRAMIVFSIYNHKINLKQNGDKWNKTTRIN